jgi:hypothetical protein
VGRHSQAELSISDVGDGHEGGGGRAAYLSLMTCPPVDQPTLAALNASRERRRAFGQSF